MFFVSLCLNFYFIYIKSKRVEGPPHGIQNEIQKLLRFNAFRRELASSGFDWHFTTIHKLSASVSRLVGADLQTVLPVFHPIRE